MMIDWDTLVLNLAGMAMNTHVINDETGDAVRIPDAIEIELRPLREELARLQKESLVRAHKLCK